VKEQQAWEVGVKECQWWEADSLNDCTSEHEPEITKLYTPKTSTSISLKLGLGRASSHIKSRVSTGKMGRTGTSGLG
jgi:hypothetical protein